MSTVATPAVGLVAALGILAGVHLHRPPRPAPWRVLALAVAWQAVAAGWLAYVALTSTISPAFPGSGDLIALGAAPALLLAAVLFALRRQPAGPAALLLDAGIAAAVLFLLAYLVLVDPWFAGHPGAVGARATALTAPGADLLAVALLGRLMAGRLVAGRRVPAAVAVLAAGFAVLTAGDALHAVPALEGALPNPFGELLRLGAPLAWGALALSPQMRALTEPASSSARPPAETAGWWRPRLLLTAAGLAAGPLTLTVAALSGDRDRILAVAASWLVLASLGALRFALAASRLSSALHRERDTASRHAALVRAGAELISAFDRVGVRRASVEAVQRLLGDEGGHATAFAVGTADTLELVSFSEGADAGQLAALAAVASLPLPLREELDTGWPVVVPGKHDVLVVPFGTETQVDGALCVTASRDALADALEPVRTLSTQVSLALQAIRLREQAERRRWSALASTAAEGVLPPPVAGASASRAVTDLHRALLAGEFVCHFQPIVDLHRGSLRGFETLVRWQHPRRGLLGPDAFLPLAEEAGLLVPLGRQVLAQACTAAVRWGTTTDAPRVSVNLSPSQLLDDQVVSDVRAALRDSGLAPHRMIVEVTETAVLEDTEAAGATMRALRDGLGVQVAFDDFGTGYSSLSWLLDCPLDALKIDKSFLSSMALDEGKPVVNAVVALGQNLGLSIIAEGIETPEQLAHLQALGCNYGQGWLLGRPVPADEAHRLVLAWSARSWPDGVTWAAQPA